MNKKMIALSVICIVTFLSCEVNADFQWPPSVYEIPYTVADADIIIQAMSGLNNTIKSISDAGVRVMGILMAVGSIVPIFLKFFK